MDFEQQISWTVLPAGLTADGTQVKVSVFIAPRLLGPAPPEPPDPRKRLTLDPHFPDFLRWPEKIALATFDFAAGEGTVEPSTSIEVDEEPDTTPAPSTPFVTGLKPQDPLPDVHLWQALFGAGTPLDPYTFERHTDRVCQSYSTKEVGTFVKSTYAQAAMKSPEAAPPPTRHLVMPPSDGPTDSGAANGVSPESGSTDGGAPSDGSGDTAGPGDVGPGDAHTAVGGIAAGEVPPMPSELRRLYDFHTLVMPPRPPTLTGEEPTPPSRPPKYDPDFHEMLTWLGDHPTLLRHLGLVLDFHLPADLLPVSSGQLFLKVIPHWKSELGEEASHDVSPRTRYVFLPDHRVFAPRAGVPTDGPLTPPARGLVKMKGNFALEPADIDAAARKMIGPAENATGLATVRTHGIALVRDDRVTSLQQEFARAAEHDAAFTRVVEQQKAQGATPDPQNPGADPHTSADQVPAPELFAENLVRGHRLDIWDKTRGRWFSLHEREVEYRQSRGGPLLLTASDEGFFQAHLLRPPPETMNPDHLYVPEQLVTWDGWSLSAPRPGLVLDADAGSGSLDEDRHPNEPVPLDNEAQTKLPLEITPNVRAGTLPRLRFGTEYRVRMRTVDLAGNGLDKSEADALVDLTDDGTDGDGAAAKRLEDRKALLLPDEAGLLTFQRFEPVLAPTVVARFRFGEGASDFRLVIRSSPGSGPPPATAGTKPVVTVHRANVQPGMTNDEVRIVQQALIDQGHPLPGGPTGVFDGQTRAAYADEQRAQGFRGDGADGKPGCTTLVALGRKSGFTVADCGSHGTSTGTETATAAGTGAGMTAEQYAEDFNRSSPVTSGAHVPYRGTDERHVVAPKASLRCIEWHGLLDEAIGSTDANVQNAVYDLAVRESGSLSDPSQPDVEVTTIKSPAADPKNPANSVLYTGQQIELPYLPDPLSTGAVFLDLPGMPEGQPFPVPWDGDVWHRPRSLRLRLAEGTAPPHFDEAARVVTVSLPKGAVATVRVCSRINFDEHIMGVADWCRNPPDSAPRLAREGEGERAAAARLTDDVLALAAASQHWMFTPWQELTLVHAVQQPLKTPVLSIVQPTALRPLGATAEHLSGAIALDEASTDRVDLIAEWTEVRDAGREGRDTREMTAPVFDLLTAWAASQTGEPGAEPALLRAGVLTFNTEAAEKKAQDDAADAVVHPDKHQHPSPPNPGKHEFGDTRHRAVRYHPLASSKFADYFPADFAGPGKNVLTVAGQPQEHSVPSSARPTAPRLQYCVPTLTLEEVQGPPGVIVHRRHGRGIRVYLDRPWYSSGDGELLGVVLGEPPGGDPTSVRDAWVTLMGRDPIHRSAPVVSPTPEMFTNAVHRTPEPLPLDPPSIDLPVLVVGFTPQFEKAAPKPGDDPDKAGRWFCDLDLDTGDACLPFVRLALVRYQPESVPGAEISKTVLADLVRTLPDRELRVTLGDPLTVSVSGPSWDPTGSLPPRITATLQRRNRLVDDDDLGWVTLDDTTTQLTSVDAESSHTPFYTGQIPLPPERCGPLRVLVLETEGIRPDVPASLTTPGPVIYCDTVELPPSPGGDHDHDHGDGHDRGDGHDHGGPGDHDGGFGGFHHH
ncbi:peptidoglycan-binding protein [Streptomyces sp. NPDC051452]|uniref:peptidoglycan-binding protein n=1 Tax=Streptomyces sp. NPDC051452 TaxID=3365654 RepID=UPI00379993E6